MDASRYGAGRVRGLRRSACDSPSRPTRPEPAFRSGPISSNVSIAMPMADLAGEELSWSQPRFLASGYELSRAGNVIGRLTFRSAWGSLATAEIDDGCWTFKRLGFLKTRVSVGPCQPEEE